MRVGLIGFGAIGSSVGRAIVNREAGNCELTSIFVQSQAHLASISSKYPRTVCTNRLDTFVRSGAELVVEAASREALANCAEDVLTSGADLFILSVSAFSDQTLLDRLVEVARQKGRRLYISSGGMAGFDWLGAAALGSLHQIQYTLRKPPVAWLGTIAAKEHPGLEQTAVPIRIFQGTAREAGRLFPQSANSLVAVALATVGLDRLEVQIYADPTVARNTSEVTVMGDAGQLQLVVSNTPAENPRTGVVVAHAVVRALRNLTGQLFIGA